MHEPSSREYATPSAVAGPWVLLASALFLGGGIWAAWAYLDWSNDLTEAMLYLITMCAAPWILRQGQHIRVDILLRAIPKRTAWYLSTCAACVTQASNGCAGSGRAAAWSRAERWPIDSS